jgi:hypothetical protein
MYTYFAWTEEAFLALTPAKPMEQNPSWEADAHSAG